MASDTSPGSADPDSDIRARFALAEQYVREEGHHQISSELTLGLLHKLNNLMTGVYFNLETADEELDSQHPASATLRAVTESIQLAQELVRRTADLNLPPESEASYFEIGPLIEEHWDLVKIILPKSATCEFVPPEHPLYVQVSSEEFREALLQLALATRDATLTGHVHVKVQAASTVGLDLTGFQPVPPQMPAGVAVLYRDNAGAEPVALHPVQFRAFMPERGGKLNRLYRAQELIHRQHGSLSARSTADGMEFLILLPGVT